MALKKNVFTEDVLELIDKLVTLNHSQFFINAQLKRARSSVERNLVQFDKNNWAREAFWFGSGLPIFDAFHDGQVVIRAPTKGRVTQGNEVFEMLTEMERRSNSFLLVSLHELFEEFIRSVYGKLRYQLRNGLTISDRKKFHSASSQSKLKEGTPAYFKEYANYKCRRNCDLALKEMIEHVAWKKVVITHLWNMTFQELVIAIGFCRHRIIHAHGRILPNSLAALNKHQVNFVKECLHKSLHSNEPLILPDSKRVRDCYEAIASFGRVFYVLVSEECGMADECGYFK